MEQNKVYGSYAQYLPLILEDFTAQIVTADQMIKEKTGFKMYEHLIARIKTPASMAEKCQRKNLPLTPESTLVGIHDSIGIRIICGFVDDVYQTIAQIKALPQVTVYNEKDYITTAKPNGYRSYHLILKVQTSYPDVLGNEQGSYFVEVQIRTIAMDSWASLEHEMKYKHEVKNPQMITKELKRCADELASCDLTMQTIRDLIQDK